MNEVSKWKKITASGISDDHSRNRINGTGEDRKSVV